MESSDTVLTPIAIIGMACEFAGDIHSPTDLWHALAESRDMGSAVPQNRFDLESYSAHLFNQDNDGQLRRKLLRRGYFLSDKQFDTFEASFFGLSDAEASSIDPCHRLLMLKFVHLLDDAGYSVEQMNGSQTSVHIGQFSTDHSITSFGMEPEHRSRFHGLNSMLYNAAARLSYHFNLQGANVSLDVACSSSLQALQLAVQSLRSNEVDKAVCGGVNCLFAVENFLYSSLTGAPSPDGRSRSFSADANGYAKGDGLGLVLLKRLSDAERDGDRIYCVIHDVLSNHDGNEDKSNYFVPSAAGQERLLAKIYSRTKFDPRRIFYIEAHGTGTPVGDPIEANCLGHFFSRAVGDPPLLVGSVKSNLGHTEGAAGVAGLIKVALCMYHRMIPPNMQFTSLNPKIEAQRYNLHVVQHPVPFPPYINGDAVAIGINSFGIGGNNAHAIVKEYQHCTSVIANALEMSNIESKQYFLFLFSTKSRTSLNDQVAQLWRWWKKVPILDENDNLGLLQRISQQLLLKRTISYTHLAIFVFADVKQLEEQIDAFLAEQPWAGLSIASRPTMPQAKVCFVFSGQGPQWWAMGRQLYESEPVFARWIRLIDAEICKINRDEWSLLEELISKKSESESRINDTNIAQPALFAVQVGLAALLISWNVFPSAIISHSAGDQAAAFVAGRLTLQEAIRVVYHRSRLQNRNTRQGGSMLAVSMSEEDARNKLLKGIEDLVCVAVVNSPRSVTLSGDEKTIDELQQLLSVLHPEVFKARLQVENAFHSQQMDRFDIERDMLSSLSDIRGLPLSDTQEMFDPRCAQARIYSSVVGGALGELIPVNAHYWWTNVRQCVRFRDAMAYLVQDDVAHTYLELSPHPVLATSIRECYAVTGQQPLILPTLKRKENEQMTLLTSLAQLTASPTVWQQYFRTRDVVAKRDAEELFDDFPLYAFHLTPCWYESKDSAMKRLANRQATHPLLGVRQLTGQTAAVWKCLININLPQHAYLRDHLIQDAILFPAVAYLELVVAACQQLIPLTNSKQPTITLEQINFVNALVLSEHELTEVFTHVMMPLHEWCVYSRPWSAAGPDCMRTSGMSCVDVVNSFIDPDTLSQYSLHEFTLHAHGRIGTGNVQQQPTALFDTNIAGDTWSTTDMKSVYTHLATRGYQYGPSFRNMQSLRGTTSTVVSEVSSGVSVMHDLPTYHLLHPSVMDACLHPFLTLLPGATTTFLPVSIHKFVSAIPPDAYDANVKVYSRYRDDICGLGRERTHVIDLLIQSTDKAVQEPLFSYEGFTIQQVQGVQDGRWSSEKSIFDKLNAAIDLPNVDHRQHLETLMNNYCMKQTWTETSLVTSVVDLLPSPKQIARHEAIAAIDQDVIDSLSAINELAACYAQVAISEVDLSNVDEQYHSLWNTCHSLASTLHERVTWHSIQLRLAYLLGRFVRLRPLLTLLNTYGSHLGDVFSGQQAGLDVFLGNEDTAQVLQQVNSIINAKRTEMTFQIIVQHLRSQQNPSNLRSLGDRGLRILWIANGEHLDAVPILHLLTGLSHDTSLWIDLHYADADPTQLAQAEQTFQTHISDHARLSVIYDSTFDLSSNESLTKIPFESFDIVFAANKLQGSADVVRSLGDLRRLLMPRGLLLLLELVNVPLYYDIVFGLFDQWWSPSGNTRTLLNAHQWTTSFQQAGGFADVESVLSEYESTLLIAQKTTSQPILQTLEEREDQAWLLFAKSDPHSLYHRVASHLPGSNTRFFNIDNGDMDIIRPTMKMMMTKYTQLHIIYAWSLEQIDLTDANAVAFEQLEESICGTFARLLQIILTISPHFCPFVFVLTRHAQCNTLSNCNIIASPLIGLAHSLIPEYERYRLKLIDLQASSTSIDEPMMISALTQHILASRYETSAHETVLRLNTNEEQVKLVTCHYELLQSQEKKDEQSYVQQGCITPRQDANQRPFRLRVAPSRFLSDLTWVLDTKARASAPHMIEVRVHCVGINFRDVLKARGLYPHTRAFAQPDEQQAHVNRDTEPGSDFVGTVVRASADAGFEAGDRVVGVSVHGVFHSHITVEPSYVVPIPEQCALTDEQLAVLPVVCLTVIYSLKYRVHLQRGQTVLVHAATGGAGQICIQYCRSIGAHVLATAGSEEKRRFLREHYGIEHVFNSRDTSFANSVRAIAPDGVDIVVNSLSGVLLKESIKLLAPHGHFVEWGKRDIFDKSHLSLFDLRSDCSLHVVDLNLILVNRPDICNILLHEMIELLVQGRLRAIAPTVIYEPFQVIDAFMRCNSGQTMGKTAVRLTASDQPLSLNNEMMFSAKVCTEGTIVISGGFGGLGLRISRWMIEKRGVQRIVLMSRRTLGELEQPSNPQYSDWLRLRRTVTQYGAHVDVVQADVTNFAQVHDLIKGLNRTTYPVRGIIHSAAVIDDRPLQSLTREHLTHVLAAKARGAWILHQVTQLTHAPLHFFILFSSIRNHLLEMASAAYNAGNQFLDALAQYRATQLHLPALSVSLPAVSGAGMFHRQRDVLASLQATQGFELVPPETVFELIERFHVNQRSCPCPIIFAVNWHTLHQRRQQLSSSALRQLVQERYASMNLAETSAASTGGGSMVIAHLRDKETIIERIRQAVSRLLGAASVDRILVDRSLVSQGMDSLAALSLYNWLGQETSIFIPLVDLMQGSSIEMIATAICSKLNERQKVGSSASKERNTDIGMDSVRDNEVELSDTTSYRGTENIICLQCPRHHSRSTYFCVSQQMSNDTRDLSDLFVNKISAMNNQQAPVSIYVIQTMSSIPTPKSVQDMMSQMRRIQPRGPYQLVATRNKHEETIAREMMQQLRHHSAIVDVQLLLIDE